ncbi:MAG: DsrE family protein [Dehalococcoidia bacterium]
MAKLMFVGTHGSENPTKSVLPFLGANGASEAGIEAEVFLVGDAVVVMKDVVANNTVPMGWPPLKDLMATTIRNKVSIFV